jgi:hypothetical protein
VSSELQFSVVPPVQEPAPLHVVEYVHRFPSSHVDPLGYVTVQLDVPLHARSMHASSAHVIAAPVHTSLPLHASPYEHGFPSSHPVPSRHCQIPPRFVHLNTLPPHVTCWHAVCVVELHTAVEPPPHAPFAPFAPQPMHVLL